MCITHRYLRQYGEARVLQDLIERRAMRDSWLRRFLIPSTGGLKLGEDDTSTCTDLLRQSKRQYDEVEKVQPESRITSNQ